MKVFVVITLSLVFVACGGEQRPADQKATVPAQDTASPPVSSQEHTIDVAGEFTPASVTIAANTPVRLHFRRGDKPSCGDEIVFPELNMRKKLAENQTVTFDLPPQQARTLTFVCGMNMMKGTVVVQ